MTSRRCLPDGTATRSPPGRSSVLGLPLVGRTDTRFAPSRVPRTSSPGITTTVPTHTGRRPVPRTPLVSPHGPPGRHGADLARLPTGHRLPWRWRTSETESPWDFGPRRRGSGCGGPRLRGEGVGSATGPGRTGTAVGMGVHLVEKPDPDAGSPLTVFHDLYKLTLDLVRPTVEDPRTPGRVVFTHSGCQTGRGTGSSRQGLGRCDPPSGCGASGEGRSLCVERSTPSLRECPGSFSKKDLHK